MFAHLRSANISLLPAYEGDPCVYSSLNRLWQSLRRASVEASQASAPDRFSFADECLLFAQIVTNAPSPAGDVDISEDRRAGLVYLHAGLANIPAGEANVGVIVKEGMRQRGYARQAVQLVLGWAFEELKFHRVQAAILDTAFKDRALRLFIGSGFVHEGTKRRAVYQPEEGGMAGMWKDATYLAMLDTEWMLQSARNRENWGGPVTTVWDEMFTRHAREREELLEREERHAKLKRSSSMETLKENMRIALPDLACLTDDAASDAGELSPSAPSSPTYSVATNLDEDWGMDDVPDVDQLPSPWSAAVANRRGLQPPALDHSVLSLPSIPSRPGSEGVPQSPATIRSSSSSPTSTPPLSPSPLPSLHTSWSDDEDEASWGDRLPARSLAPATTPHGVRHPHARPSGVRSRSRSDSASSVGSGAWSDAQSSASASSGWDVVSNSSDSEHRG